MQKVVVWFSCGATSAVAARMALMHMPKDEYEIRVVYCNTGSEHEDNIRFLCDVEHWIQQPIEVIRSDKYIDIWDVFEKTGWLVGVGGARCTTELKKRVRQKIEKEWMPDFQVFGFDAGERHRAERFRQNNPEVKLITPLIRSDDDEFSWCTDVDKQTCLGILTEAGIQVPAMYRLGFNNANCIGCVKGGAGYWNHVRKVFPKTFWRMAKLERKFNVAILKTTDNDERRKVFLDELDPEAGKHEPMNDISCDLLCGMMYDDIVNPK